MITLALSSAIGQTSAPAAISLKNKEFSFSGKVGSVDPVGKKITIKTQKGPVVFDVSDKTKISRNAKDAPLNSAKVGEEAGVRVKMTSDGKAFDVISVGFGSSAKSVTGGNYPYAVPVTGKPHVVESPFSRGKYIDVEGFPHGTEVKDPYTGKIFRVP